VKKIEAPKKRDVLLIFSGFSHRIKGLLLFFVISAGAEARVYCVGLGERGVVIIIYVRQMLKNRLLRI